MFDAVIPGCQSERHVLFSYIRKPDEGVDALSARELLFEWAIDRQTLAPLRLHDAHPGERVLAMLLIINRLIEPGTPLGNRVQFHNQSSEVERILDDQKVEALFQFVSEPL